MSFNPFAAGGVDVDKLPYFVLRKVQSIGTSHGFELVKIEPMRDNRETSMGRLDLEDLFVRSGEIVKGTEVPEKYNPDENKTYMHLILSDDEGTEVYIDVTDLIDMPDAGKVPLDNDNTLTIEQLNLIKKIFGDNISANTTVLDIILSIASIFENTEIWAEDVRVKNVTNGGAFEFQYVFKPNKSTDQVQLALQNIDKEFKTVHDNITTIAKSVVNLETKVDNNYNEINDNVTIINNSISSINNSIITIEGNITKINTNIDDMNKIITNHTTAINTINEQITNINKTISDNYTDLSKKNTAINNSLTEYKKSLLSKFSSIDNSISGIQGDITTINQEITSIKSTIESIQTDLSNLEKRVTQNEKDIESIKEELKKLVLTGEKTLYGTIDITNQKVKISESIGRHSTENSTGEIFNDYTNNIASGRFAHASGYNNQATADYAVAINSTNRIAGNGAFGSGYGNTITEKGIHSLIGGFCNISDAPNTFTAGYCNQVTSDNEVASGIYNKSTTELPLARSVGNGTSDDNRSNLEYLSKVGDHYIEGSYMMTDIPENADLNDYFTGEANNKTTNHNKWYRATGAVARTLKNMPQTAPSVEASCQPKFGFILKTMAQNRDSGLANYPTSVQVMYCGTAIYTRTFTLEAAVQWGNWTCIGGLPEGGISSSYLNFANLEGESLDADNTKISMTVYDSYHFVLTIKITPLKDSSQKLVTLSNNLPEGCHYFIAIRTGYDFSKNNGESYRYKLNGDFESITIVTDNNNPVRAGETYTATILGYIDPILKL